MKIRDLLEAHGQKMGTKETLSIKRPGLKIMPTKKGLVWFSKAVQK